MPQSSVPSAPFHSSPGPHVELVAENALLRRQLIVLRRQVPRAKLTHADRWWMVLAARLTQSWRNALLLVQPATLLRWHRAAPPLVGVEVSPKRTGQPTIAIETAALIRQMATENQLWGAERIRHEVFKLGLLTGWT
jgi:hypothetical protein